MTNTVTPLLHHVQTLSAFTCSTCYSIGLVNHLVFDTGSHQTIHGLRFWCWYDTAHSYWGLSVTWWRSRRLNDCYCSGTFNSDRFFFSFQNQKSIRVLAGVLPTSCQVVLPWWFLVLAYMDSSPFQPPFWFISAMVWDDDASQWCTANTFRDFNYDQYDQWPIHWGLGSTPRVRLLQKHVQISFKA